MVGPWEDHFVAVLKGTAEVALLVFNADPQGMKYVASVNSRYQRKTRTKSLSRLGAPPVCQAIITSQDFEVSNGRRVQRTLLRQLVTEVRFLAACQSHTRPA